MQTKRVELIETKADASGSFTALASVFGNEDLQGDRVMPGAFKATIKRMKAAGSVLPIVSSHVHDDPRFTIGVASADDLTETDKGLQVKGQLDLENPIAAQVHRLFKSGAWTGWSFGYSVLDQAEGKDGVNELRELDLIEAGPCLKGANPEAQLLEAKSALAAVEEEELPEPEEAEEEPDPEPEGKAETAKPRDPLKDQLVAGHIDDLRH